MSHAPAADNIPRPFDLPPNAPRFADGPVRRLCRALLHLNGWSLRGRLPDLPQAVLIGAPHSSWWDGIWGLTMKVAIGVDVHFMAKRELFHGPLGGLLRRLGGVPIDRSATTGVVEQMVARFATGEPLWLGITPEGTRKPVKRWKSGFWHIAHNAGVPVVPVYFHYPERVIGIGEPFVTSGDTDADLAKLHAFYRPYRGKYHGV